jgi:lipid-A-disaccharide synthase
MTMALRQPAECMVVAGEPSGDLLGAGLVRALKSRWPGCQPRFFGVGGPELESCGVELAVDLTRHSIIGLVEALKSYRFYKRVFDRLVRWACERQPEFIVCIDFSGFNRRLATALRKASRNRGGSDFQNWRPRMVQFVSPQVWASRPGRVKSMERDLDLLLSIFPFEKEWYAQRAPRLSVEWVGHPLVDRGPFGDAVDPLLPKPLLALLPGSRRAELALHLPPLLEAVRLMKSQTALRPVMVLPRADLVDSVGRQCMEGLDIELRVGGLAEVLRQSALALASTGTVTLECALHGVPTVAFYKTSWSTYHIGKRIIQVPFLAMPNLLAGRVVMPELVQHEVTGERIAAEALKILSDPERRADLKRGLGEVSRSLGEPGACERAAEKILRLLER